MSVKNAGSKKELFTYDPKEWGPSRWEVIHSTSFMCETEEDCKHFIWWMNKVCKSLFCTECRQHATNHMDQDPPIRWIGKPDEDGDKTKGMFMWTHNFHNKVNRRLAKRIVSYKEAKEFFQNTISKPCTDPDCDKKHVSTVYENAGKTQNGTYGRFMPRKIGR